jgi:hypothetical protein
VRALLVNLTAWIKDGVEPPPSARPTIAAGTLVAPDQVHFPPIPANAYGNVSRPAVRFLRLHNPLHVHDYGEDYRPEDSSGLLSVEPPKVGPAQYGTLVAQVDADGNDLGGIRNVFLQVPIGTYTGWNLFNRRGRLLHLAGKLHPVRTHSAGAVGRGDPRLSIEECYPSKETYVAAIKKAVDGLVADRYLLPEDASRLVSQAEREGRRSQDVAAHVRRLDQVADAERVGEPERLAQLPHLQRGRRVYNLRTAGSRYAAVENAALRSRQRIGLAAVGEREARTRIEPIDLLGAGGPARLAEPHVERHQSAADVRECAVEHDAVSTAVRNWLKTSGLKL